MMTESSKESKRLAEHFFRHEYSKMVAVMTRYFGLTKVNLAEDVVQDTLLEAINTWEYRGIPENPTAWLYTVAKNKALNVLRKDKRHEDYISQDQEIDKVEIEVLFSEEQIADDQLKMMFACCHPAISQDAQVSLTLKTLCGLSIGEIASAFLTSNETINKRLVRARKTLKEKSISFEIPNRQVLKDRLENVLKTIYLLFNEGYSASHGEKLIRYDLCMEAIRLTEIITSHQILQHHAEAHALQSLMLLNAARFESRIDHKGTFVRMVHQDRSTWNQQLIRLGLLHLDKTKEAQGIGRYQVMAAISAYHCTAKDYESTNWSGILNMYDALGQLDSSPLVQMNRAVALSKVKGAKAGISELLKIETSIPESYYLFHSTLAEFYMECGDYPLALERLKKALNFTKVASEIEVLQKRIITCEKNSN